MYGGTARAGLCAVALAVCLSGTLSACQDEPTRSATAREPAATTQDPDPDPVQFADYDRWRPTYRDVRAATEGDVLELGERVDRLNASAYTVQVPAMGIEVARSPEHVRVSMGAGTPDIHELHLDPRAMGEEPFDIGPFVVCSVADDYCTEGGVERPGNGGPHLFDNALDSFVFTAGAIAQAQGSAAGVLRATDVGEASMATVDSPTGRLDCLVAGGTLSRHERLEGQALALEPDPVSRDDSEPLSTTCVDERGLVVVTIPSLVTPVVPYTSFEAGVPDDFDRHAEPVPYGTSPSATPTDSTTSGSDGLQQVLVAVGRIRAGESLADARAAGRFELTSVPGSELLPGAVSSTSGLGGVALREIEVGEQITAALFG
jgi:hypothetical protein